MMFMLASGVVVTLLLGYAAFQELYILGIRAGQVQPFWAGIAGLFVCWLMLLATVAIWRRWARARELAIGAGWLFIGFHVYASLPPHRNVGIGAALVACGYGAAFLVLASRHRAGSGQSPTIDALRR